MVFFGLKYHPEIGAKNGNQSGKYIIFHRMCWRKVELKGILWILNQRTNVFNTRRCAKGQVSFKSWKLCLHGLSRDFMPGLYGIELIKLCRDAHTVAWPLSLKLLKMSWIGDKDFKLIVEVNSFISNLIIYMYNAYLEEAFWPVRWSCLLGLNVFEHPSDLDWYFNGNFSKNNCSVRKIMLRSDWF